MDVTGWLEAVVGADWLAAILALVLAAERLGKVIPDDATGALGVVRKFLKTLGAYVENKK